MDDTLALRRPYQGVDLRLSPLNNPAEYSDDVTTSILFHDLGNPDAISGTQMRTTELTYRNRFTEDRVNCTEIGHKAIRAEQQGTTQSTATDALHQAD